MLFNRFQYNRQGNPTLGDLVEMGYPVFDDSWQTEVPEHKTALMQKIIREYYFYEIGQETPDRFRFNINAHLARIMPYYNQLYRSELIKFDPMLNYALKTSERTIENLVALANNSNSALAKAVRNFANNGLSIEAQGETSTGVKDSTLDKNGEMVYNKHGNESINETESVNKTGHEDDTLNRTIDETVTFNTNVNEAGKTSLSGNDTEKRDDTEESTGTRTPDLTEKIDSTKGVVGTGTSEATGTSNKTTETEGTGEEKNNLKETTNTASKQDYSDTPQKKLPDEVRQDYLTNVTWTDTDTTHNADSTKNNSYNESKTEKGDTTDNSSTTSNEDTTIAETKTNTGTETSEGTKTLDGTTTTTYGKVTDENKDTHKTGTEDTATSQKDVSAKDTTEDTDRELTRNKDWEEHGGETNTDNTVEKETYEDKRDANSKLEESKSGAEQSDNFNSSVGTKDEKSTRDTGGEKDQMGYFNVSASSLLKAFRDTFLNIDEQIVKDLYDEFMTVF